MSNPWSSIQPRRVERPAESERRPVVDWFVDPPDGEPSKPFETKKAALLFIEEQRRIADLPVSSRRVLYSVDLPCVCGATLGEHASSRNLHDFKGPHCPSGGTRFQHAHTDPIEPQPCPSNVGHVFGSCDRRLYRYARKVLFHNLRGESDAEMEPFEDHPEATGPFERKLISGRAIGRTYHHHRKCPCGEGYWGDRR